MKIFVVHIFAGCCNNNSDGKMWIVAENATIAKIIAKQHTRQPIMYIEEFNVENEVIFSTERLNTHYQLKNKTNSWGNCPPRKDWLDK